jgi:cholesterol transport system auxiliary component
MGIRKIHLAAALVLSAILSACAQPQVPTDHFYRLQVAAPKAPLSEKSLPGIVEVRFSAEGLTAGRPLVYSFSENLSEVSEYHYHFWTEPPAVMLRDRLVNYLRAAGVADKVVTPEMRTDPDFIISAAIKRLERVIGDNPGAVAELEISVKRSREEEIFLLETYSFKATFDRDSVGAAVASLGVAVSQIYTAFLDDLSRLK